MNAPVQPATKPVCAITGAGGYVGGCLKDFFARRGWDVLALTRRPEPGARAVQFQLGCELPVGALTGARTLVHCAYDFNPRRWGEIRAVNVEGARKVLEAARAAGLARIVCISSISAFEGCRSLYGRAKLEIERLALAAGALVIRPGLVYGDRPRAMFGRLVAQVRQSALIPLVGSGSQLQYLVHNEDLAAFILQSVERVDGLRSGPRQPLTAANEQAWTLRQLLSDIGRGLGRKPRFISLPWRPVWMGLRLAEASGLRLKFHSDSLISLMHPNPAPDFQPNAAAGLHCRPFRIEELAL